MANEFKIKKGLIVQGSGSTILDIQGSQGQLFSITDLLSGSLFSVNDISGIPIVEVFSDNSVNLGTFGNEAIKVLGNNASITGSLFGTASFAQTASVTPSGSSIVGGTGANGQVAFWDGVNSQTGDNGLFWDNTNKRLGVGLTNPTARFHIFGTGTTSSTESFRVTNSTGRLLISSEDGGTTRIGGPTSKFMIGVESGVGVTARLVVNGTTHIGDGASNAGALFIDQGGTSSASRILQYDGGGAVKNLLSANGITYFTGGNVGIGSTTAGARLDVRAQGALSTDIAFRVRNSADTANLMSVNGIGELVCSSVGYFTQGLRTGTVPSRPGFFLNVQNIACNQELNVVGSTLIGLNGTINSSSQLQVDSTTRGFLPPRMTNAQRLAIASPAIGLMVYCTDETEGLYINKSTGWTFII